MAEYRVRIIERSVLSDSAAFLIEATCAEEAARIVLDAAADDVESCGARAVVLPDGREAWLDCDDVVHGEIVARVENPATDEEIGTFGGSVWFEPGPADTDTLVGVMEQVLADPARLEAHSACRWLLRRLEQLQEERQEEG
ncbi:hypothetical protein [Acetobacter sicerae]|uniref:hypothetical protein n=1 Tax=Acetobacter sicerae TaxID=85325 RepID=UPI00156B551D|nr:hypothetical protein [Acetobacter sicerae]NHN93533.1 hypothetical protein [Acetobacter sicerae]